jgi:hypothetical protein
MFAHNFERDLGRFLYQIDHNYFIAKTTVKPIYLPISDHFRRIRFGWCFYPYPQQDRLEQIGLSAHAIKDEIVARYI